MRACDIAIVAATTAHGYSTSECDQYAQEHLTRAKFELGDIVVILAVIGCEFYVLHPKYGPLYSYTWYFKNADDNE